MIKYVFIIFALIVIKSSFAICDIRIVEYGKINGFVLPVSLKEIDNSAFEGTSTDIIRLSESVELIGERAFSNVNSLKAIYIPSSVTFIGNEAFDRNVVLIGVKDSFAFQWSKKSSRHFTVFPIIKEINRHVLDALCNVSRINLSTTELLAYQHISINYKNSHGLTLGEVKLIKSIRNTDFRIDGRAPPHDFV